MVKTHNVLRGTYRNILDVWERSSQTVKDEGRDWYPIARRIGWEIDEKFHLVPNSGAGILAALSPQMGWGNNITEAWNLANYGYSQRQSRANNIKALRIRDGESPLDVLGGNKVRNFYKCIVSTKDRQAVIDRHAIAVYMARNVSDKECKGLGRKGVYERVAGAYARASNLVGIAVEHMQATTWQQWRIEKGIA